MSDLATLDVIDSHSALAATDERVRRGWIARTIGPPAWRKALVVTVLAPLALASLVIAAVGGSQRAAAWQRSIRARAGVRIAADPRPGESRAGVVPISLGSIPIGVIGLVVALLGLSNTMRQLVYPLTHTTKSDYVNAWGGPTLAGAWAAHVAIAAALVPVYLLVLRGGAEVHARLVDRVVIGRRSWWLAPALAVLTLATAIVVIAVAHQIK
jgi:hypothetical protein